MDSILLIEKLKVGIKTKNNLVYPINNLDLQVKKGDILGIVGESGCGKSILGYSMTNLLPKNAKVLEGEIKKDKNTKVALVFQDAMNIMNPSMSVGRQIQEAIVKNQKVSKKEARKKVYKLMEKVGIENPEKKYKFQPYLFSGGERQRLVIALALGMKPDIIICDEATTALDLDNKNRLILLLKELNKSKVTIIFISHDLETVFRLCNRISVMYCGTIVEEGLTKEVVYKGCHPYTWSLLMSMPQFYKKEEELITLDGKPLIPRDDYKGDYFAFRNPYAMKIDYEKMPVKTFLSDTHYCKSWLLNDNAPKIEIPKKLLEIRKMIKL